jgi:ABC-type multidrug transport system ATPase subunit
MASVTMDRKDESENLLLRSYSNGFQNQKYSMRFTFDNMSYSNGKGENTRKIIDDMTGCIRPGKLTAVMGPSGSGKSTLLSLLLGKTKRTSGTILINDQQCSSSDFASLVGFVPQEDVMLGELTVFENIYHSAKIRLPSSWTTQEIRAHVETIIQALNLTSVSHSIIGDDVKRGISGGQRKRVNVAIELAGIPLALFLDEPTSGLDSTSALSVIDILRSIALLGNTVVAVLHQPRIEIFSKLDDILLVSAGKISYCGPAPNCQGYFESLGYTFPPFANPADVLMDILSANEKIDTLGGQWAEFVLAYRSDGKDARLDYSEKLFLKDYQDIAAARGASWHLQLWHCSTRYTIQQLRNYSGLLLEIFVALAAGILMGASVAAYRGELYMGIYNLPYSVISPAPLLFIIPLYGLLIGFSVALSASPAGVRVFSEEKTIYWREASAGHSTSAYYLGKTLAAIPRFTVSSLHFVAVYMILAVPTFPNTHTMYSIIFLTFWCVYGVAAFVSCLVSRANANLLAVIFCIFSASLNGFGPSLLDARDWGIGFVFDLSYSRWATEAMLSFSVMPLEHIYMIRDDPYGYTLGREGLDLGVMFLIGLMFRVGAYAALKLVNRDKQK